MSYKFYILYIFYYYHNCSKKNHFQFVNIFFLFAGMKVEIFCIYLSEIFMFLNEIEKYITKFI